MLSPSWEKNDKRAKLVIVVFSVIVFVAISVLGRYNLAGKVEFGFDVHIFAFINALINATVTILLLIGFALARQKKYLSHKRIMLTAMFLSVLFLISYVCHHLFAGETMFGETDGTRGLSEAERVAAGDRRTVYLFILATHIPLAGLALPFILFAAYRAMTGEYARHKKIVRIIWPMWLYVAITGVIVYWMIRPYYS